MQVEDELHYLRDCPHAREIWLRMGALHWRNFLTDNLNQWVKEHACGSRSILFVAGLWGIWKWRNNGVFEDEIWSVEEVWRKLSFDHDVFLRSLCPENEAHGHNHMGTIT